MDITHDNVCSSMLSCFYSHLLSTGRPISSFPKSVWHCQAKAFVTRLHNFVLVLVELTKVSTKMIKRFKFSVYIFSIIPDSLIVMPKVELTPLPNFHQMYKKKRKNDPKPDINHAIL